MSTTDTSPTTPPPITPPPAAPPRALRRSRTGRVGAGVAAGLGDYFGLDPLLFRVLFATSAFFGGAGVIAYLVAWAAIPEEGTDHAALDRWMAGLRRRRVPAWAPVIVAAVVLWALAFSWWAPGPFLPVLVVVGVLIVAFGRQGRSRPGPGVLGRPWSTTADPTAPIPAPDPAATPDPAAATAVDLTKRAPAPGAPAEPAWYAESRAWLAEQRTAARERRRRAAPIRIAVLATLATTLVVLGAVDAVHGIALPLYFLLSGAIVLAGLIAGLALRRTPWSLTALLVPVAAGLVAFAGTSARLHDGIGQTEWRPGTAPAASYRLAIGQGVLDLRHLAPQDRPRTIHVTMAAGQVKVLAPPTLNLTVRAHVHLGNLTLNGDEYNGGSGLHSHGINYNRTIPAPRGATGAPITVVVRLADGTVSLVR